MTPGPCKGEGEMTPSPVPRTAVILPLGPNGQSPYRFFPFGCWRADRNATSSPVRAFSIASRAASRVAPTRQHHPPASSSLSPTRTPSTDRATMRTDTSLTPPFGPSTSVRKSVRAGRPLHSVLSASTGLGLPFVRLPTAALIHLLPMLLSFTHNSNRVKRTGEN